MTVNLILNALKGMALTPTERGALIVAIDLRTRPFPTDSIPDVDASSHQQWASTAPAVSGV